MGWTLDGNNEEAKFTQRIAWLIASAAQFRTETGAASATAALAYIHLEADDTSDTTATRPRAVIDVEDEDYSREIRSLNDYQSAAGAIVSFEFLIGSSYSAHKWDRQTKFLNKVGTIIDQMKVLSGTGTGYFSGETHLSFSALRRIAGPTAITGKAQTSEARLTFIGVRYRMEFDR